ncbi:hypothetical protein FOZ62_003990 [Perkinsus olseni]|uniref:Uncharacterized protein n=1 Tax=Perkinsus olseni TaxID=32597 RepID=A0A7J6T246_PEROL|nr:hypothetical protein FOZ62_003990 [Perkinsus olseni]
MAAKTMSTEEQLAIRDRIKDLIRHSDFACFRFEWSRAPLGTLDGAEDLAMYVFREIVNAFDSKLHRILCTGYMLDINARDAHTTPASSNASLLPGKSGLVLSELRSLLSMCKLVRNDQRMRIEAQEANISPLSRTLQHEPYYYRTIVRSLFEDYPYSEVSSSRRPRRREPTNPVDAREVVALLLTDGSDRESSNVQFIYQLLPVVADMVELVGPLQALSSRLTPAAASCSSAEQLIHASFVFDCPKLFRFICMHATTAMSRGVDGCLFDWPSLLHALWEQPESHPYLSPLLSRMCRGEVAASVTEKRPAGVSDPFLIDADEHRNAALLRSIGPASLDRIRTLFGERTAALLGRRKVLMDRSPEGRGVILRKWAPLIAIVSGESVLAQLVAVEAEAVVDGHPTVTPQEVRSLDFLSKLAWGEPVHLRQSDLVYNDLPTIDQVGPLKNVKVVSLPKPRGPANWWIGGLNIMRHGPADNLRVKIEEDLCGDGSRVGLLQRLSIGQNPDASLSHQTGSIRIWGTGESEQQFWGPRVRSVTLTGRKGHILNSDPPRVTLVSTQSPVPKMFPLCAPDHGHFRYQLEIHGERFSFSVHDSVATRPKVREATGSHRNKRLVRCIPDHSTVGSDSDEKPSYSVCGKDNLAETCPFMRQGGIPNFEKHMMTQIEPRIDAVVHKVTINTSKVNPSQKFHPTDRGPHFGKVHLPKAYQDAMDRLDHTRRPAMTSNPYGIPMFKLRPGPDRSNNTADHHHNDYSLRMQDPDSEGFPESFRDVLKRRNNWEEVRISALHNGKMGLFDARHPPKNPEAVDSEAYSESHPLYDRARMPLELRHPVHEYEGFHDHIRFL